MEFQKLSGLIGKEVRIYPGDTLSKQGIIQDVSPLGVLFKITQSKSKGYKVGSLHFIGIGGNLSFSVI